MTSTTAGFDPLRTRSAARSRLWTLLGAVLVAASLAAPASAEEPLEFALKPYISARQQLAMFQPMAQYLELRLGRPVLLVTAPSLREFDERTLARRYELALMAPHAARQAQKQAGYVPLLQMSNDLYGVFLVPLDSPLRSMKDLGSQPLAFPDRLTATAQLGREALLAAGIDPGQVVYMPGFQDSILLSLLRGEFPVALMDNSALFQMPEDQKRRVRVLEETRRISHSIIAVRQDMPPERQAQIRSAIQEFMEHSEAGRAFAAQTGLTGVRVPSDADLRALDALAQEYKRLLEETRSTAGASR